MRRELKFFCVFTYLWRFTFNLRATLANIDIQVHYLKGRNTKYNLLSIYIFHTENNSCPKNSLYITLIKMNRNTYVNALNTPKIMSNYSRQKRNVYSKIRKMLGTQILIQIFEYQSIYHMSYFF